MSKAADASVSELSETTADNRSPIEPTYDDIAREAYLRYLRRGSDHGHDFDDWLEAERDLRSRR